MKFIKLSENSKLYNGKSEDVIPTLENNSIDLVITSPPYNVDLGNNKYNENPYDLYNDNKDHKEYISWLKDLFEKLYPKLKSGGRVCLHGDTLISTRNGFVKIKNINIGDEVLTHKGIWKKVTDVIKNEHKSNILNFKAENSNSILITPNHPVFSVKTIYCPYRKDISYICRNDCPQKNDTWRKKRGTICEKTYYKNYKKDFIPASELSNKDFVCMPIIKYLNGKKRINKKLSYLIGLYLSEGWISYKPRTKSLHFGLHIKEKPIIKKIKNNILELFKKKSGKDYDRGNCTTVNIYSTKLSNYFKQFGRTSKNKHIPWDIYETTYYKDLLDIVISHWFGDGSIVQNKKILNDFVLSFCTISKLLSMQIRDILIINGFHPRITLSKNNFIITLEGQDSHIFYSKAKKRYDIDMYNFQEKTKLMKFKTKTYRNLDKDYIFYKIKKIEEKEYNDFVYNIEVENDESYCLTNFAVHNCINIGDGCNGSIPTHSDIIHFMTHDLKYIPMANIIWEKSQIGNRFSWGSYMSPSCPSFPKPF